MQKVGLKTVEDLIDFAADGLSEGLARQQVRGTTALFNILNDHKVAYLADEVGLGKTYVALGVMALFRYFKPDARILIITPKENIQRK